MLLFHCNYFYVILPVIVRFNSDEHKPRKKKKYLIMKCVFHFFFRFEFVDNNQSIVDSRHIIYLKELKVNKTFI